MRNILKQYKKNSLHTIDKRVHYYNFWDGQTADEIWFSGFLKSRGFLDKYPKAQFAFFSTLGNINILRIDTLQHLLNIFGSKRIRFFFNGENNHHPYFTPYLHNLLDHKSIDLSLGFDYTIDPRYIRFPLWILEMFSPESSAEDIKNICNKLSHQRPDHERNRFCALVSGASTMLGTESMEMRKQIVESLNTIATVDCAGKLLHNTDELKTKFNDNKAEFLKQYKFYICPENASVEGYVTEKIFHAIGSGCIPIYWGSNNNPEPDVLNHDAILFWNNDDNHNNDLLMKQIGELQRNDNLYREFFEQPRLKDNAWEVVAGYFERLEQHLNDILK